MQKLFADTRVLDREAQTRFQLSEEILMENAAAALERTVRARAEAIRAQSCVPPPYSVSVLIVAGSGGNGADGYTLARRLACGAVSPGAYVAGGGVAFDGVRFAVSVLEARPAKTPLCKMQRARALACGVPLVSAMQPADVLVDCLFGSGFSGAADETSRALISEMNSLKDPDGRPAFRIACDVPSGIGVFSAALPAPDGSGTFRTVSGESGEPPCFAADVTVCMGALKTSLFTDGAADFTGRIEVADLGIPRALFEAQGEPEAFLLDADDIRLPYRRKRNAHKGTFGHSAVLCGAKPGAGIMAATAASAFGSGLTTLVALGLSDLSGSSDSSGLPALSADGFSASESERSGAARFAGGAAQFGGVAQGGGLYFAVPPELMLAQRLPESCTAIAAGMGLADATERCAPTKAADATETTKTTEAGCGDFALEAAARLIAQNRSVPAVLDADFFRWRGLPALLRERPAGLVLTPHPKEFASLLALCGIPCGEDAVGGRGISLSPAETSRRRFALVRAFCAAFPGVVLVAKGAVPVIGFCPGQDARVQLYANPLGSPALAKGGSGDVLAGLICALLAQGFSPLESACSASLAHALASRKVAASVSDWGLSPSLLLEAVRGLSESRRISD